MLINSLLATASTVTSQKLQRTALSSRCPTTTTDFSEVGRCPGWCCGQQIHGFAHPASNINILWLCFFYPFMILKLQQKTELNFINPLKPELNPICYLLALLGAHHFLHGSRIRVKLLTFRWLMSYIYIWSTHSWCF